MGGLLMTGQQYVKRWLRLNGVPRSNWASLIDEIREFSELGNRLDDRIYTYSAGMAARLYFSTATSIGNEIYLIDEVLSVGDEHFQAKCWKRVRARLAKGVSGVLVTHDWSAIMRLCEYTCELEGGQILAEGDSEEVVCGYLKLVDQLDPSRLARFSDECQTLVSGISGKNWAFDVPIVVTANCLVFFNYSIEKLILGEDWQILFIGSETLVATSQGTYAVKMQVPDLPLPSGQYRLNLFLRGTKPEDGGAKQNFDIRSWTSGNSIKLHIDGIKESGLVKLPFVAELV
jgi:lipopolysaccharide transport system ATP-binding protein